METSTINKSFIDDYLTVLFNTEKAYFYMEEQVNKYDDLELANVIADEFEEFVQELISHSESEFGKLLIRELLLTISYDTYVQLAKAITERFKENAN